MLLGAAMSREVKTLKSGYANATLICAHLSEAYTCLGSFYALPQRNMRVYMRICVFD